MYDLDIDLLRTFVIIVEEGSFTGAGKRLYRTQSTISLQLKRLESQIGGRLLHRVQGRVGIPTILGERLLSNAQELLRVHDKTVFHLQAPQLSGSIHLGLSDETAHKALAQAFTTLQTNHPQVDLQVTCASSGELEEWLLTDRVDLALVNQLHSTMDTQLICDPLYEEELVWVKRHDLVWKRNQKVPLIAFTYGCSYHSRAIEALNREQKEWRLVYTSSSRAGVWSAIYAGLGVAALPRRDLPDMNSNLVILESSTLPILQPVWVTTLFRTADQQNKLVTQLSQYIRQQFSDRTVISRVAH